MHRLFVYGTLRHGPLLAALLGREVSMVPAQLTGHRAASLAGRVYPGLVVDPSSSTVGEVVEIDDDELAVLDRFEGPDYERTPVVVVTGSGEVAAETYLLTGPGLADAEDRPWSFEAFVSGAADAWVAGSTPGRDHRDLT